MNDSDPAALLAAYDSQLRRDAELPSALTRTPLGPLLLATYLGGRGFITYRSLATEDGPATQESVRALVADALEHYRAMLDHYGEDTGVKMARKHIGWYTKGLHGSADFRNKVNFIDQADQVLGEIDRFYEPLLRRKAA